MESVDFPYLEYTHIYRVFRLFPSRFFLSAISRPEAMVYGVWKGPREFIIPGKVVLFRGRVLIYLPHCV